MADSIQYFDEVNVATALHRVAKLQPLGQAKLQAVGQGTQMSPIVYADQFQQLIVAVRRLLHRFEAQAVSNTMWGESAGLSEQPVTGTECSCGREAALCLQPLRRWAIGQRTTCWRTWPTTRSPS